MPQVSFCTNLKHQKRSEKKTEEREDAEGKEGREKLERRYMRAQREERAKENERGRASEQARGKRNNKRAKENVRGIESERESERGIESKRAKEKKEKRRRGGVREGEIGKRRESECGREGGRGMVFKPCRCWLSAVFSFFFIGPYLSMFLLYSLKTSENPWFAEVSGGYREESLA